MAKKSFGSKLYSGTAVVGRDIAFVSAILVSIFGIILIIWGIILEVHKTKLTQTNNLVLLDTFKKGQGCTVKKVENNIIVYSLYFFCKIYSLRS